MLRISSKPWSSFHVWPSSQRRDISVWRPFQKSQVVRNFLSRCSDHTRTFCRYMFLQIDYVAAQKLRRTTQLWSLYAKIWERDRLKNVLLQMSRRFRTRALLGGSALSTQYDWRHHVIADEQMAKHINDIQYVHDLINNTLVCHSCSKRHIVDQSVTNVDYCGCDKRIKSAYGVHTDQYQWNPFLERKDILVWRQEHPGYKNMFVYKMYGRFDDVTADEFLEVQLDLSDFRLSWDSATAQCFVVEKGPRGPCRRSRSEVYYWEVNWPRFFSNRDYVCNRRTKVFDDEKVIVVYSQSTEHPTCPRKSKAYRVEDYWSIMTIKPFTEFDKMGIEFSLTAFENPGLSLPSSITTWVAIRGMPEFMSNLRKACFEMRKWKVSHDPSKSQQQVREEESSYYRPPAQYA